MKLKEVFPVLVWGRQYRPATFSQDLVAAVFVTVMLIPQSLAYAMLAGVPPKVGLFASIAPLLLYAVFGSSRSLSVGPVAVVSLMTAAALGGLGLSTEAEYVMAASVLALLSGLFLLGMGLLRLGFLANFLSHPVVSGFITASGLIIAASQVKHLMGIEASGHGFLEGLGALIAKAPQASPRTLAVGLSVLLFLFWARAGLNGLLVKGLGLPTGVAGVITKAAPVFAVVLSTLAVWGFGLDQRGVAVVGQVPAGLPGFQRPSFDLELWLSLAGAAALISIIGFVESVSVGQTLAAKRRESINSDSELIGLGAANIGSALTGGFPVTGGFSRSVVNFDAGAQTPAAGALTAIGIALATLFLTPLLFFLPKATLAATIIVAVLALVDFSIFRRTWVYAKADFFAVLTTVLATLALGVEIGVSLGVGLSVVLHLYKTAKPHVAEVGLVPGTEHFRNVLRHSVETSDRLLTLRIDESLYFANARHLEALILERVAACADIEHVVLLCSAINAIDSSALESLESINQRLRDSGVTLHLSEVKGPVMDRLRRVDFLDHLSGQVHLNQFQAFQRLGSPSSASTDGEMSHGVTASHPK